MELTTHTGVDKRYDLVFPHKAFVTEVIMASSIKIESGPDVPEKICQALKAGEDVSIHVDLVRQLSRRDWSSFVRAGAKQVRICAG